MLAVRSLTLLSVPLLIKCNNAKIKKNLAQYLRPSSSFLFEPDLHHTFFFFSLSIVFWFVIGWLQFSTGRTGWFASQTPPLGVAGEIFHIQKIFSCKVAHSPIVNINCHIAILFKMCSECTNQYPRRRKKKNQHQQGGGGEETLVLQEDDQLLTMQLPLSL